MPMCYHNAKQKDIFNLRRTDAARGNYPKKCTQFPCYNTCQGVANVRSHSIIRPCKI